MIPGDFFMDPYHYFAFSHGLFISISPITKAIPLPHFPLHVIYILLCPFLLLPNPLVASFYYPEVRSCIHM